MAFAPNGSALSSEGLLRQMNARGFTGQLASAIIAIPPRPIVGTPAEISTKNMMADKVSPSPGNFEAALFGPLPSQLSLPQVDHSAPVSGKAQQDGEPDAMFASWYRRGWSTTSPKVKLEVLLRPRVTPDHWEKSASDNLRLSLYSSLLEEEMAPKLYGFIEPGASYKVVVSHQGISLKFDGFPQLLPGLINSTMAEVKRGLPKRNLARYERLQREYKELLASHSAMPITYAVQDRSLLLTPGVHSNEELLAALSKISESEVALSTSELLFDRPLEGRALIMGNLGTEAARTAIEDVRNRMLDAGAFFGGNHNEGEVLSVQPVVDPQRPVELRKQNPRPGDPNDVAVVSLLVGVSTVESRVLYGLLGEMLRQLAYNKLRTSMQLGYVVNAGSLLISNVLAVSTAIQGKAIQADHMEAAVEQVYYDIMPSFLRTLSDDDFKAHRNAYRQQLLQPPLGFSEEFKHFWSPVTNNQTCFKLQDEMLEFLEEVVTSKEPLVEAWSRLVFPAAGVRRKISVKYFAGEIPERPTKVDAAAVWQKFGVPSAGYEVLAREFDATAVLSRADSEVRAQLVRGGDYFAHALHCERSVAKNVTATSLGKTDTVSWRITHLEAQLRKEQLRKTASTEQAEVEGQKIAGLETQLRGQAEEKMVLIEQVNAANQKVADLEAQVHVLGREKTLAAEEAEIAIQRIADLEAQIHALGREKTFAAEEAEAANQRTADLEAQLSKQTEEQSAMAEHAQMANERNVDLETQLQEQANERAVAEEQADAADQKITDLEGQLREKAAEAWMAAEEANVANQWVANLEARLRDQRPEDGQEVQQPISRLAVRRAGRWFLRGGGSTSSMMAPR